MNKINYIGIALVCLTIITFIAYDLTNSRSSIDVVAPSIEPAPIPTASSTTPIVNQTPDIPPAAVPIEDQPVAQPRSSLQRTTAAPQSSSTPVVTAAQPVQKLSYPEAPLCDTSECLVALSSSFQACTPTKVIIDEDMYFEILGKNGDLCSLYLFFVSGEDEGLSMTCEQPYGPTASFGDVVGKTLGLVPLGRKTPCVGSVVDKYRSYDASSQLSEIITMYVQSTSEASQLKFIETYGSKRLTSLSTAEKLNFFNLLEIPSGIIRSSAPKIVTNVSTATANYWVDERNNVTLTFVLENKDWKLDDVDYAFGFDIKL